MKKILIAGYEAQTLNYQNAFSLLGALPCSLCGAPGQLVQKTSESPHSLVQNYDGLVLPGGGDISPALFGETNQGSRNIDEPLDLLQLDLLHAFASAGKPVLGICKGIQIINAGFGGKIIQNLNPASLSVHAWDEQDRIHTTKAACDTFPFRLYGSRPIVNSAHHQAVGALGAGLRVAQYAHDFVVEALYHENLPILGVQWHPERMCFSHARRDTEDGALLLKYFLSLL